MEARITRKTAALAIFLISAFQTYIYAGRPSSCQLLIINSLHDALPISINHQFLYRKLSVER